MLIGIVKWFDDSKGYGVIGTPDQKEFFLHINTFLNKPKSILKGTPIIFSEKFDQKKYRNTAKSCRFVGQLEDWKIIVSYLGKPENVIIQLSGKHDNHSFSIIDAPLKQYFKGKDDVEIINVVIDYFDNDLCYSYFTAYCDFIEKRLTKHFSNEKSSAILSSAFSYFGENINREILFQVWKNKKFHFIAYKNSEYEIPENVLKSYMSEIGISELRRIINFSFGPNFCSEFVDLKFAEIENLPSTEIKNFYALLGFIKNEKEREKRKLQLDNLYSKQIENELTEEANKLDTIKNNDDFNNYNKLFQLIPSQISDEDKAKIKSQLDKIIASKCSEEFKPELWIKGVIKDAPFEFVSKIFLDKDTLAEKRIVILSKLYLKQQFELLKQFSLTYNSSEDAFTFIEELVKRENSLGHYFSLSEVIFDGEFWKDKSCNDLINLFVNYVNNESSEEKKYELFFKGYVKVVPQKLVYQNINKLEENDCRKIFISLSENKTFIKEILESKATNGSTSDFDWLYDLANEFLDSDRFNSFDKKVFEKINQSVYFKLWETGKAKLFPEKYLEEILKENLENYIQIENWINNYATTWEEIASFLFSYLSNRAPVTDRIIFLKQLNHIKYLLQINELHLERIKQFQNGFYNLILWYLDKEEVLDFVLLKQKFVYFTPDQQVRIIRKLFFLKAKGQFDLTVERLNELTRFDLDLYKTNLNFKTTIPIDISTDVIIKALASYKENQRFFVESELLSVILNDLKLDKTKRFKLSNYFENCLGRQTAKFNWSREGEIKKIYFDNNQFYFAISFSTGETKWVNNRWGGREVYYPNPNFESLKEAVKKLPGIKWNPNEKHWGVPSKYEADVLAFAKEHRFFLDFEGSNYANNTHLAEFKRQDIPNGISFCEGRLANRPHEMFKKIFWWCAGQPCFEKCEHQHSSEKWESYTLLDFCEILELNTDETNRMGDFVPKGIYYQFVGLINRFNRLLEKLYCQDCNQILYPVDTGHFAAHTVVRFHCVNNNCSNNNEVYLNHCLNGQCNSIIDSRISKKCSNGLFICDNCGSCCSHEMLKRRLANLQTADGYIHPNLKRCVDEKLGHLERGEYFCFKCKNEMDETSNDIFHCSSCNVTYDTTKYKFKRPHKYLKQTKGLTGENGNNDNKDRNEDGFDFPF